MHDRKIKSLSDRKMRLRFVAFESRSISVTRYLKDQSLIQFLKKHCWLTQNLLRMILVFFKLFLKLVFVTVAKYNGTVQTQHSAASHYPRGTLNSCSLYNWCILFLKSWIWVLIDALYSTSSLDWSWLSFMDNCAYSFWKQKVSSCQ